MYRRWFVLSLVSISFSFSSRQLLADIYESPTTYYTIATGTGTTLLAQLRTIVASMTGVNYGNARYGAAITDRDPNNPSNVLLIYNRASVSSTWDAGATWDREHIWPQSRLGASASNGSTNIASDLFNLRPCNPSINGSRSNKPYGMDTTTGVNQHVGSYYYPGDTDQGDVARSQFYMVTRWSQLSLTDATPSGLQMGDLSSLVAFHLPRRAGFVRAPPQSCNLRPARGRESSDCKPL
jgi:endonuclease I